MTPLFILWGLLILLLLAWLAELPSDDDGPY